MPKQQDNTDLKKFIARLHKDREDKGWDTLWTEIRDNILPDHGRYLSDKGNEHEVNRAENRRVDMLSPIAEEAVTMFVSGFKSNLTNQTEPWVKLSLGNHNLRDSYAVKAWLEIATDTMLSIMSRSNFYDAIHNVYQEFSVFGTGVMLILEDPEDIIYCKTLSVGEYELGVDSRQKVDTIGSTTWMTVQNIVNRFGEENVAESVKNMLKSAPDKLLEVYHLITPNDGRIKLSRNIDQRYVSVFYDKTNNHVMEEGFYNEFPAFVLRWNVNGCDVYGTEAPGMKLLSATKQLYTIMDDKLEMAAKLGNPPMWSNVPLETINTLPNGFTSAVGVGGEKATVAPVFNINPQGYEVLQAEIAELNEYIRNGFFNNLFMMISQDQSDRKTAFEVARLQEEKLSMLGPVVEIVNKQLDGAIDRIFDIMMRRNVVEDFAIIEPPPPELEDTDLDVEYISLLARAQKTSALRSIDSFYFFLQNVAATMPDMLPVATENIDVDAVIRTYYEGSGAPIVGLVDEKVRDERRAARQAAEAEAQQLQQANLQADSAQKLGKAEITDNNALGAIMGAG